VDVPIEALEAIQNEDPSLLTEEELADLDPNSLDLDPNSLDPEFEPDHYRNLAKDLDDNFLGKVASDLIELVESDEESREDWFNRVKCGLRNLGVSSKTTGGASFPGASKVVHPVLMEACTQFQARAIQEMWSPQGPVQTQVLGTPTPEKEDQASRVQDYMNYLYTVEMTEAFDQEDNMLLRLPISGSTFKKMFYDPLKKRLSSLFVEPADFLVSYQTVDLETSPRFTHRIREYKNDVRKKENSGFYIKGKPFNREGHTEDTDKPNTLDEIDLTQGLSRSTNYAGSESDEDEDRATMYEVYVDYNIEDRDENGNVIKASPSCKDKDQDDQDQDDQDQDDQVDPIYKPYIITIDRDLQTVKRIQRNWKPDDEMMTKRMYFTHYKFTPGLGFYGYGFLHLIGDMASTATGALRSLLDAASFANLQGGFRTRHSRTPGGDKPIAPGEWREVDSTSEELHKAFFHIPYREPSSTLFNLLNYVDDKARHLAGITETVTGEASAKNAPVGTTAMLLEQGTKVFTSIHKRIHEAHKKEFRIMAELIEEYMPDEGYPYLFGTKEGTLLPSDFDKRVDVLPISDPNISSNAQRVAKAQSILELQQSYPHIINEREAVKRMLEAIQVNNIDLLIGSDEEQTQKDQESSAKQQEKEDLEKQRISIETDKLYAEVDSIASDAVKNNLDAVSASFEAAAIALTSTELIPTADALLKSAGFKDANDNQLAPPIEQPMQPPIEQPMQEGMPMQPPMEEGMPMQPPMEEGMPMQPLMEEGMPMQPPMEEGMPMPPMEEGMPPM